MTTAVANKSVYQIYLFLITRSKNNYWKWHDKRRPIAETIIRNTHYVHRHLNTFDMLNPYTRNLYTHTLSLFLNKFHGTARR